MPIVWLPALPLSQQAKDCQNMSKYSIKKCDFRKMLSALVEDSEIKVLVL